MNIGAKGMTSVGWCAHFPPAWADLMWGLDDESAVSNSDRKVLVAAGIRVCESCPVRFECLADAIVRREQHGIRGGLPLRTRRRVRSMAAAGGVDLSGGRAKALHGLTRWLKTHKEIIPAARDAESADRKAKRRRQRRLERAEEERAAQGLGGREDMAGKTGARQGVLDV